NELRAEGRGVHKPIVDHPSHACVVEDAGSAAQTGFGIAEDVPGETNAWRKVVHAVSQSIVGDILVAGEEQSSGRVGENRGVNAGDQVRQPELLPAVLDFAPGPSGLPAQAQIQNETAMQPEVVLDVKA